MAIVVPGEKVEIDADADMNKEGADSKPASNSKTNLLEKLKKIKWPVWVSLAVVLIAVPILTVLYFKWAQKDSGLPMFSGDEANMGDEDEDPPEPVYFMNPINGELILEEDAQEMLDRLPVCVVIENLPVARPQVGLSQADMVYEALAEGGITRFVAVYWSQDVEKLMPVRSARYYFAAWVTDISGCVFYHIGEARTGDPATYVRPVVNKYKINNIWDGLYSRDQECDSVKNREHCAYTSTSLIWEEAKNRSLPGSIEDVIPYKFKDDLSGTSAQAGGQTTQTSDGIAENTTQHGSQIASGVYDYSGSSHDIHVNLSKNKTITYQVVWSYDHINNVYKRAHGSLSSYTLLEDAGNNEQVAPKNVAIIMTRVVWSGDHKNHNFIDVIGGGDALILIGGKIIEGTWEKRDGDQRTTFYGLDGDEIEFNRGQLWIQVMPRDNVITVKHAGEQTTHPIKM